MGMVVETGVTSESLRFVLRQRTYENSKTRTCKSRMLPSMVLVPRKSQMAPGGI